MSFLITHGWIWFCITFSVMLTTVFIMNLQSRKFYTQDVILRKFSIIDLEFPASAQELVNIIKGIYALPGGQSQRTLRSLRGQLYVDFLFMPAAYIGIFILCMQVSSKMSHFGHYVFAVLGWLQAIPWICDIIENIYLLNKIRPEPMISTPSAHKAFERLEVLKWGIPLLGTVCSFSALFYFWLTGLYSPDSLPYILIIVGEIIIFMIARQKVRSGIVRHEM
jgi:hypothetical protein